MSLQTTDPPRKPTTSPPAKRLGAKVKAAIDRMVWDGRPWNEAAQQVGLSLQHMRVALEQQHVQAYLRAQRQVFREGASTRANFRMVELSEQDDNRAAAVSATKVLMGEPDQQVSGAAARAAPGFTILIRTEAHMPHVVADAAKPLIEHEVVPVDEHERHPRRTRE